MSYVVEFRASDAIMSAADTERPDSFSVGCEEFVQVTYHDLRVGPDGRSIAFWNESTQAWRLYSDVFGHLSWSDIVITFEEEE